MKKILYIIGVMLAVASCTKTDEFQNPNNEEGAVQFTAGTLTKVTTSSEWQADDRIGVFAGSVENSQYKIKVDNSGEMEFVSGDEIYPAQSGATQDYYAYYPYGDVTNNKLSIDLTASPKPLLWAKTQGHSGRNVAMQFSHQLVKLNLTFTAGEIDFSNLSGATATLKGANTKGEFDVKTGAWTTSKTAMADLPLEISSANKSISLTTYVMATSNLTNVSIIVEIGGETLTWKPVTTTWIAGETYNYNITVGKSDLRPAIGDYYYSDGSYSTTPITGKDDDIIGIVFWVGNPINPSANGSGLTYLGDLTMRSAHYNCVNGLVVAINDVDGGSLWQSVPSEVEPWRRGLGLITSSTFAISTNGAMEGETLNRIAGYNNSKVIKAYNEDAQNSGNKVLVYEKIEAYATTNPAPSTSSGWYLPSIKELVLLCGTENPNTEIFDGNGDYGKDNIEKINGILRSISGASELGLTPQDVYWSSTEHDDDDVWLVNFGYGLINNNSKETHSLRARAVLAF